MKLATYKDGSRDGQLVVVSRDLSTAHYATGAATRMQQALDDWNFISPQLQDIYVTLNQGKARHAFPFEPRQCMAPLPRAYQWADGSAYINHVELVRKARGAEVPESFYTDPLMYQGGSDDFLGPCDDAWFGSEAWGIDFEAEIAVITGDVAMGASPEQSLEGIRLIMLANDWSLRNLIPAELAKGFGFFQSKPATAFSPVAVTPEELGDAWMKGRVHLTLQSAWNDKKVGLCEAGPDMTFHFGQLIAHIAKTRNVRTGSIVGSGTVSNTDWSHGYSCIAEKRAIETIEDGVPKTGFMKTGDTIRIEMKGRDGMSIFGAIDQRVTGPEDLAAALKADEDEAADEAAAPESATDETAAKAAKAASATKAADKPEDDTPAEHSAAADVDVQSEAAATASSEVADEASVEASAEAGGKAADEAAAAPAEDLKPADKAD